MTSTEQQLKELDEKIKSVDSTKYTLHHEWWKNIARSDYGMRQDPRTQEMWLAQTEKKTILEIGVYEGGSVCWFSDHFMDHPESRLIAIDPFTGSTEHSEHLEQYPELTSLEQTARGNIYKSRNASKIDVTRAKSQEVYSDILKEYNKKIDVLYIDGDHSGLGVMIDTCLYAPLVKSGGLIIWDDYGDSTCGKAIDSCLAHIDFIKNAVRTHWQLWARVK
jgi:predicted O-methyltransferase YrrM